jgi:hypothetical protein
MNNLDIFSSILLTGVGFGIVTYILIVRQSFKDKTFGMPVIMACANFAGDFICSFIYPPSPLEKYINMFWLLFDVMFIFLYLKYGKNEFSQKLPEQLFYPHFILVLVFSYLTTMCIVDSLFRESYSDAFKFIGIVDNFIMSIMFCSMFLKRNRLEGQSVYIAFFKLLGSLCIAMAFCLFTQMSSILYLCVAGFCIFDFIYFILVYQETQSLVLVYQEIQNENVVLK